MTLVNTKCILDRAVHKIAHTNTKCKIEKGPNLVISLRKLDQMMHVLTPSCTLIIDILSIVIRHYALKIAFYFQRNWVASEYRYSRDFFFLLTEPDIFQLRNVNPSIELYIFFTTPFLIYHRNSPSIVPLLFYIAFFYLPLKGVKACTPSLSSRLIQLRT